MPSRGNTGASACWRRSFSSASIGASTGCCKAICRRRTQRQGLTPRCGGEAAAIRAGRDAEAALEGAAEAVGAGIADRGGDTVDRLVRGAEALARFVEAKLFDIGGGGQAEDRGEAAAEMAGAEAGAGGERLD